MVPLGDKKCVFRYLSTNEFVIRSLNALSSQKLLSCFTRWAVSGQNLIGSVSYYFYFYFFIIQLFGIKWKVGISGKAIKIILYFLP